MTDSVLARIDVEAPCSVGWDSMRRTSDERVRFCGECRLEVWNLSGMSQDAAEGLVRARLGSGESICARFARRPDGTVVTQDCGPVRREVQGRAARLRLVAAGLAAMLVPVGLVAMFFPSAEPVKAPAARPAPSPPAASAPAPVVPRAPVAVPAPVSVPVPDVPASSSAPAHAPPSTERPAEKPPESPTPPAPDPPVEVHETVGKICLR